MVVFTFPVWPLEVVQAGCERTILKEVRRIAASVLPKRCSESGKKFQRKGD